MRILVHIGHPAHVHFFKNILRALRIQGWDCLVLARSKEVTWDLLRREGLEFSPLGGTPSTRLGRLVGSSRTELRLIREIRRFRPHVLTGVHDEVLAVAGRITGAPSAIFVDSEPVPSDAWLTYRFADVLWTPESFSLDLGDKHLRFPGFKELAYLHPKYFSGDKDVIRELGLKEEDPFVLVRWVGWKADHDRGHHGVPPDSRERIINRLAKHATVFISSEGPLPQSLEMYRFPLPSDRLHHALAFAALAFTDGQTFATEAAVLGVPSVRTNSMAYTMSNFRELESRYGLVFSRVDPIDALEIAEDLLLRRDSRKTWQERRSRLLQEKVDVVDFGIKLYSKLAQKASRKAISVVAELTRAPRTAS